MQSQDRCVKCGVLLDKPWMRNSHRCIIEGRANKKFIKQFIIAEAALISFLVLLMSL